jgi:hypothetical protein
MARVIAYAIVEQTVGWTWRTTIVTFRLVLIATRHGYAMIDVNMLTPTYMFKRSPGRPDAPRVLRTTATFSIGDTMNHKHYSTAASSGE